MILITGAAGFIGSNIVKAFNDMGMEDLILVDEFESGAKWLNLRGLKFSEFVSIHDLFSHSMWDKKVTEIKGIYHMGACSDTTEHNMDYLLENNTHYTNTLLTLAAQKNIPIIYASSAATYGAGEHGYSDDHTRVRNLRPMNKYGYSKQLSDEWILKQKKKPKIWYGVKFFNVFGPNEYHKGKMSSVVYQGFQQIQSVGEVKLFKSYHPDYKDGGQLRDFVYVKDVVRAMIEMMRSGKNSGIYNLGTGKARSFHDLASATFTALGKKPNIHYKEMPDELKGQYQYYTQAEMQKLKKLLPKFKFMTLEEAVADYVQKHLDQADPFLRS